MIKLYKLKLNYGKRYVKGRVDLGGRRIIKKLRLRVQVPSRSLFISLKIKYKNKGSQVSKSHCTMCKPYFLASNMQSLQT